MENNSPQFLALHFAFKFGVLYELLKNRELLHSTTDQFQWWEAGVSGNDFWTFGNGNGNGSAHSQTLGTGTGMINCIPNFWEREREWKFHSQFLGTGTGMEIPFPNFGNGNETLLFPGMTGNGNGNGIAKLSESFFVIPYNWYCDENHDKRR